MLAYDVVIVGGGPAGISAAIWCHRLGLSHVIIESQRHIGGQLHNIYNPIVDYPGLLLENGEALKNTFQHHLEKLNCPVKLTAEVTSVNSEERTITVLHEKTTTFTYHYKFLIFATGASPKCLNVPGEKQLIERGEVYSATRDAHKFKGQQVVVIGGGDRAFEGALLLAENGANVHLVHHNNQFKARDEYKRPVFAHKQITIHVNSKVVKIDGHSKVTAVHIQSDNDSMIPIEASAVFIRIGVQPNSQLIQRIVDTDDNGYIHVDKVGQTSHPYIFSVGDVCTLPLYSSIISATGQAMSAVKQIALLINAK